LSETIFMIHCMGGGPWTWDHYARFLPARGHTCIATTLRYHDADPRASPEPGWQAIAGQDAEWMERQTSHSILKT
jgi:hypothetical protein